MFSMIKFIRKEKEGLGCASLDFIQRLHPWDYKKLIKILVEYENKSQNEIFKILDEKFIFAIEKGSTMANAKVYKTTSKKAFDFCNK